MLQGSVSTMVDAAPEHIWRVMLSKIELPELNLPKPDEIHIVQRSSDYLLRESIFEDGHILERVTVDNSARKITYTLVRHQHLEGYISHQLLRSDNSTTPGCILAFAVDTRLKQDQSHSEPPDLLEQANDDLFYLKDLLESGYGRTIENAEQETPTLFET